MSDTMHPYWTPSQINAEFNHKASELAEIGDLMWWDSTNHVMRPASAFTDGGDGPTQISFASVFAGVSNSKQLASDATARNARLVVDGIYEFPCASATFAVGDYVTGSYSTGLLDQQVTKTTDPLKAIGRVVKEYQSATTKVKVRLRSRLLNAAIFSGDGAVTATSITGTDSSLGVTGQAGAAGVGGAVAVTGGAGDGSGNAGGAVTATGGAGGAAGAGGAVSVVGGVPVSGNAAGGAGTFSGGAGSGTGAGGAVTTKGGASGAGATGNGGAWTAGGGAALSTNGTGGAVSLTGGVATGTGTGGAVTITSGASAGASGTAGAVAIDCGAAAGGTAGAITIAGSNAGSVTFGKMPRIPTATVAATGSVQGDAAAVTEGFTLVTAADATKGVKLPAAVAGMQVIIKNADAANAVLKIWPNTSDAINALSADAAFSIAAKTSVLLVAYDATTWYSVPLLPS